MQGPRPHPAATAFPEALILGCSIGLLHAMAETALLGWYGVRPAALDLGIIAAASAAAGGVLAVIAALLASNLRWSMIHDASNPALARRQFVWSFVIGGYFLAFAKIVSYWGGHDTALKWCALAAPPLALAWLAVSRKGNRAVVPVCAAACVVTTLCGLHLMQAEWSPTTAHPLGLLAPAAVCFVLLAAAVKTTAPGRPFEPLRRAALPLAIGAAAWAGLWVNVYSRVSPVEWDDGAQATVSAAANPNILLVVFDTVRADHLDLFGYDRPTMPNLRRFAREECQYANRSITAAPWTVPSHASMFTGLYPSAHGAHYPFVQDQPAPAFAYSLREDVPTLAEFLRGLGYQTAAIAANFAPLSAFGLPRGFEEYDVSPGSAYFAPQTLWLYRLRVAEYPSLGEIIRESSPPALQRHSVLFSLREPPYRRAEEITTGAQRWLRSHAERPFFLFVNYLDAHDPYLPAAADDERFSKRPAGKQWQGFPRERYHAASRGESDFTPQEIEFLRGQYDAGLVSLDREFARLLDYLKSSGLFDNTLILVTSDHGESFMEHGYLEHGNTVYQPEINGFLLIKTPRPLGAIQPSPLMQSVDFFPTIAAVLNEPVPAQVQGSAWGKGRDYALSEVFCSSCAGEFSGTEKWPDRFRNELVSVIIGDLKLIHSTAGPDQVYDLRADPGETNPMANPDPEFVRRAEAAIAERNQHLVEELKNNHPNDKVLLEKLRSLGYVK